MNKEYQKISETEYKVTTLTPVEEVINVKKIKEEIASYEQEKVVIDEQIAIRNELLVKAQELGVNIDK